MLLPFLRHFIDGEEMFFKLILQMILLTGISQAECTHGLRSHLRAGPGTQHHIIKTLPRYTPLEILERLGDWLKVKSFRQEGYIYKKLVSDDYSCVLVKDPSDAACPTNEGLNREINYLEGFRIVKKEIGCNQVKDKWGRKMWLNSANLWPETETKMITIPSL